MPDNTTTSYTDSPEKAAFTLAEQGTLEIIDLMGAADRLKSAGLKDQTIALYRLWLEHSTSPLKYVGYFNLGVELASERDYQQAEAMYRKALELNPEFVRARLNLGNCLEQQKRDDEALEQWRIALESKIILLPENISLQLHALNNLGRLLEMKKNYKDSLAKLEESFALDPTQRDVLLHLVHLVQKICRWPIYTPPKGITKQEMIDGTSPLAMLAASDDPKLQLAAARQFVEHKYPVTSTESLAPKGGYKHEKIRIGYLSSDFCLHAVSLLMVELLELHDHDKFEVYGFCWSRVDDTSIQRRVQKSMDHYIKIGEMNDKEAAECIRSHEIDIMIDLQGLTSGARPLILSYRPATLQMTYLGFPGTTGLPWIDYVIADKYLIPDELTPYHTEKPLYMPNCFQSSDSKREVGAMPTRADNGLPEKAFVFCSFNNNYKFTPEMFASWMRILKHVPGSVFWLLADNEWAKENLIKEAKKHGIKKDRLIFAPRVAPADYLARYQLADLFLDTFPFNGGTTANDALFMGLPLLTLSGRTFASRMAGSLLTNLGLTELIANSLKEYEEKAARLAKKPAELKVLKGRLKENKLIGPVFDLPNLVKDFEYKLRETFEKQLSQYKNIDQHLKSKISNEKSNNTSTRMDSSDVIIEIVSATRLSEEAFWSTSALGQSIERIKGDRRIKHNISFQNLRGLPEVYNERITTIEPVDILVFIHDDVWIDDFYFADRIIQSLLMFDVVGVVGNKRMTDHQTSWAFIDDQFTVDDHENFSGAIAHGKKSFGSVQFLGLSPAPCQLLDGLLLAAKKQTLLFSGVRFDPQFEFHFYDLDFCRTAMSRKLKLGTWPISLTHQSGGAFNTPKWVEKKLLYRQKWERKPEYSEITNKIINILQNKKGIEIGGPSRIFKTVLPVYNVIESLDGVNFANNTIWEGNIVAGNTFRFIENRIGSQFISDGTNLDQIQSNTYDFVLSSNCLEHIANPIKALIEWKRILKTDGYIVLVLPQKYINFDHRRPDTTIQHLLDDYNNSVTEYDLTHLDEILEFHDLLLDPPAGTLEQFRIRSLDNFNNRTLHHHVFDLPLINLMLEFSGFKTIEMATTSSDYLAVGKTK